MTYRILADLIIALHFLWILFIVFGIILVLRKPKLAWIHLGGLLFSLFINTAGWYCPLTYLEYYLYRLGQIDHTHSGTFIARYLETIVYPQFSEKAIRSGEIIFVLINIVIYLIIGIKLFLVKRQSG